jgi:hypothetical protein
MPKYHSWISSTKYTYPMAQFPSCRLLIMWIFQFIICIHLFRGSFHLLTEDEVFVSDVRLPRHIVPDNYNVEMVPFILEGNFTIAGEMQMEFR